MTNDMLLFVEQHLALRQSLRQLPQNFIIPKSFRQAKVKYILMISYISKPSNVYTCSIQRPVLSKSGQSPQGSPWFHLLAHAPNTPQEMQTHPPFQRGNHVGDNKACTSAFY